jgi:hypothetical protein
MEQELESTQSEQPTHDPAQELLDRVRPAEADLPDFEPPLEVIPVSTEKRLGDLGASLILAGVLGYMAWFTWPAPGPLFAAMALYVLVLAARYGLRMVSVIHLYKDHFVLTTGRRKKKISLEGLEVLPPRKRSWIPRDLTPIRLSQDGKTFKIFGPDFTDGRNVPRERFLELLLERGVKVDWPGFAQTESTKGRSEVWIRSKDPSPIVDGLLTISLTLGIFATGIGAWLIPTAEILIILGLLAATAVATVFYRWARRKKMACLVYEDGGLWLFQKDQIIWEAPAGQIKGLVIETRAKLMKSPEYRICVLTLYGRRLAITPWTWRSTAARKEVLELARSVGFPILYDEGAEDTLLQKL